MKLLENELVKRYFDDPPGSCIERCCWGRVGSGKERMAMRVLESMEQPIKKGDRYLLLGGLEVLDVVELTGRSDNYQPRHWGCLRLPDRFQPAAKKECKGCVHDDCQCQCECHGDQNPKPTTPPATAEEIRQGVSGGTYDCKVCERCGKAMTALEYHVHWPCMVTQPEVAHQMTEKEIRDSNIIFGCAKPPLPAKVEEWLKELMGLLKCTHRNSSDGQCLESHLRNLVELVRK